LGARDRATCGAVSKEEASASRIPATVSSARPQPSEAIIVDGGGRRG
jgi:hypothetical protein